MKALARIAVVTNFLLALLFTYSSFSLWNSVNAEYPYLIASHWSPLGISAPHYVIDNGNLAVTQTLYMYFNTPFWVFWVVLVVNLYFIFRLQKSRDPKSTA